MKILKTLLFLMVIVGMAISCKSEKKAESTEANTEAQELIETEGDLESASETSDSSEDETLNEDQATEEKQTPTSGKIVVNYPKDDQLATDVDEAIQNFIKGNPEIKKYFESAYGFAVYPKITKAGLALGGAGGHGLVFDNKKVIGGSRMAQATFGLQAGGQQYMEVIFFEDQPALNRFTSGKIKFSGQASAVALAEGTSVDIDYQDGVAIFTKTLGGLMAEASVGGQSFKFKPGIE